MIRFDEALALMSQAAQPIGRERLPLHQAARRRLASPVLARIDGPRDHVSTMDGYAVQSRDLQEDQQWLRVAGYSYPGQPFDGAIGEQECVRIFTGAPLPIGADRVVIQENVTAEGDRVLVPGPATGASWVRNKGSDFVAGTELLSAGAPLRGLTLVAAAAADVAEVEVYRRPRVAIVSTGNELVRPGLAAATPFAIPETLSLGLGDLIEAWGGSVTDCRILHDDLPALQHAATDLLASADLVIVTGGASVGERDFAKDMFRENGLELVFSKVAIKPGKPVWLGRANGKLVLGLPGNPSSAIVTARLFLAPLVIRLGGGDEAEQLKWQEQACTEPLEANGDRETFLRGVLCDEGVTPLSNQDSGGQKALAAANCLIRRRIDASATKTGDRVSILLI